MKKRVFAGIRATGKLHLGNYEGSIKGMLKLQEEGNFEPVYMVVDVHAITTPYNVEELRVHRRDIIIGYLASGLDPKKNILTYQSLVPEHTELAFYFSSVITAARMQHLPTFKEKVRQYPEHVTMALLNYPILMAADILAYKAELIPAGVDQEPHFEVAREIARKMNQQYGTNFPDPVRMTHTTRFIPSLSGEGKMSKSVEGSYINLTDSLDEIRKKIRSIPTATMAGGEMSQGVKTLFTFAGLFMPDKVKEFKQAYEAKSLQFVTLKDSLSEAIYEELKPLQERRKKIEQNHEYVDQVIKEGAEKARNIASQTVKEVKEKMGLV